MKLVECRCVLDLRVHLHHQDGKSQLKRRRYSLGCYEKVPEFVRGWPVMSESPFAPHPLTRLVVLSKKGILIFTNPSTIVFKCSILVFFLGVGFARVKSILSHLHLSFESF